MHDRERLADGLTEDLQIARASAAMSYHIRRMVRARSSLVRLAPEFVWLAMRNARDACAIHLWKAIDTQKSARSIPWLIRHCSTRAESEKKADLRLLSVSNPVVKALSHLRHEVFAHRGKALDVVRPTDVVAANNISESDFLRLVRDASSVLRRHIGRPLTMQFDLNERNVLSEIIDLDVFLEGSYRGRYGIETYASDTDIDPDMSSPKNRARLDSMAQWVRRVK